MKVVNAIKELASTTLPRGAKVTLFGSQARGDARDDSDWDILILVPGGDRLPFAVSRSYSRPFEDKGWEMDVRIDTIVHSYAEWEKRSFLPLYHNIEREGIIL